MIEDATIITVVTIILAAIPGILTQVITLQHTYALKLMTQENTDITRSTKATTEAVAVKADHVVMLTNSNLEQVKIDLAIANQKIIELQAVLTAIAERTHVD